MIDEDKKEYDNCDAFLGFFTFVFFIAVFWFITKSLHERSIILNEACERQHNTESKN